MPEKNDIMRLNTHIHPSTCIESQESAALSCAFDASHQTHGAAVSSCHSNQRVKCTSKTASQEELSTMRF